jgi:hypothetical protein
MDATDANDGWRPWEEQTLQLNAGRYSWDNIGALIGKSGPECERKFISLWEQEVREERYKRLLYDEGKYANKQAAAIIYDALTKDPWYSHGGLEDVPRYF